MEFGFQGKTAVVTGASRGIGLAIARAIAGEGAQVVAGARTISRELQEVTPLTLPVDLSSPTGPGQLVDYALSELGGIDLLVNNVGAAEPRAQGFLTVDDDAWQRAFDVNFFSAVRATRAALPSIIERQGSIVNIGSINSRRPVPHVIDYCSAKAALANFGKALAEEFGPAGVRVNTISPGPVVTDVWTAEGGVGDSVARQAGLSMEEMLARLPAMSDMSTGHLTQPEEVAALVVFLASRAAPNVSGAEFVIDGGNLKTI